jgi:hypothetical protein
VILLHASGFHGRHIFRQDFLFSIAFLSSATFNQLATQANKSSTNSPKDRGHLSQIKMARGNQRDKAREATQKKMADQVNKLPALLPFVLTSLAIVEEIQHDVRERDAA